MRAIVLFLNLWLILLSGGNNTYAETQHVKINNSSTQHLNENKQFGFSNKEQNTTIIEDTDFDFEEEYATSGNAKENNKHKVFYTTGNLSNGWNTTTVTPFITQSSTKKYKISQPFYGYSSPIYIKNRVLRI
ncbi:hypothetical protein [Flavobacterium sp.]|uniref:hypothetical protein n=1 Tax=Flavobacterium sp. TaxID=239 RepID=UPI002617AC3F|nr:hypothetical protein [Flavobacterium sp.]